MSPRTLIVLLALSLMPVSPVAAGENTGLPPGMDAYAEDMREQWSIPGIAVAVIRKDGEPIVKTYGLRQWDRPEKVDPDTMFGIASITKTFVAAGIAKLVDSKTLDWDDPVVKHLPEFRTKDSAVTAAVTVRDLLSHRSGIETHGDWLEEVPGLSEAELVARLSHVGQSVPFRARPQYNNYGFVVLAQIIERVSGMPWGAYLTREIWHPLGMKNTFAHADAFVPAENVLPSGDGWSDTIRRGLDAVPADINVAAPHVRWEKAFDGKIVYDRRELENTTAHFHKTAIDPSQAVFSSLNDMARWARFLLRADDSPVLSAKSVRALRQMNSIRGNGDWAVNGERDTLRGIGYGLGMEIYRYRGRTLFGHAGDELGYSSKMVMDTDRGVGVVVLVNNLTRTFTSVDAIAQFMLDHLYGAPVTNWSARALDSSFQDHTAMMKEVAAVQAQRPPGQLTASLSDYAGRYTDPFAGELRIEKRGKHLIATTGPSYEIELKHWGADTFHGTVISPLRLQAFLTFSMDASGKPSALSLRYLEIPEIDLSFRRDTGGRDDK